MVYQILLPWCSAGALRAPELRYDHFYGGIDWENCEHLKYVRNVYCIMTNYSKDQGTLAAKPQTIINAVSRLIVFFLATQ